VRTTGCMRGGQEVRARDGRRSAAWAARHQQKQNANESPGANRHIRHYYRRMRSQERVSLPVLGVLPACLLERTREQTRDRPKRVPCSILKSPFARPFTVPSFFVRSLPPD